MVDDDPQIREVVGPCLIQFGAAVTLCKDAFAAIAAIKKVQPDAVLADLVMPGRHGLDLLYHIRSWGSEHGGDVPGIIITGLRDPELENEIRNAGFGYLAKPFTPIKLINTVTQALGSLALLKQPLAPPLPCLLAPLRKFPLFGHPICDCTAYSRDVFGHGLRQSDGTDRFGWCEEPAG